MGYKRTLHDDNNNNNTETTMHSSVLTRSRMVATPRRTCIVPRANLLDDAGKGIVRIFSPPTSTLKDISRPEGSYKGEKSHSRRSGPFKDGFVGASAKTTEKTRRPQPIAGAQSVESEPVAEVEATPEVGNIVQYLGTGLRAMVSKNFSRTSEEPEWMKGEPTGYSGPTKRGKAGGLYGSRR